jgi:hypothetical protein
VDHDDQLTERNLELWQEFQRSMGAGFGTRPGSGTGPGSSKPTPPPPSDSKRRGSR